MKTFATEVVSTLRDAGYVAYFAGGCVRDMLLGVTPKDYDIATSASPEDVRTVFGKRRTIPVGQSFGVITVLGPKPLQVEVATFRSDGTYSDGRRPDSVVFSSPEEDAKRRDFTINGMFFDPIENNLIDFVGGQDDLKAECIRAIGCAADRIEEDRLRMLRAVRFAATFDFVIEPATLRATRERATKIASVSQERITHELQRMLQHSNRSRALELLQDANLLKEILPALTSAKNDTSKWQRLLQLLDALKSSSFASALALLLGPYGASLSSEQLKQECRRLKIPNETRKSAVWIADHMKTITTADQLKFSQLQPLLAHEDSDELIAVLEAICEVEQRGAAALAYCRKKRELPLEQLNPDPLINGSHLARLGLQPGPKFAELLRTVRDAQLDGHLADEQDALNFVQERLAE